MPCPAFLEPPQLTPGFELFELQEFFFTSAKLAQIQLSSSGDSVGTFDGVHYIWESQLGVDYHSSRAR